VRQRILLLIRLSTFDNGAYYLQVLICLRTAMLFSVSKQAQGGVDRLDENVASGGNTRQKFSDCL
jgi:hypothetical protein